MNTSPGCRSSVSGYTGTTWLARMTIDQSLATFCSCCSFSGDWHDTHSPHRAMNADECHDRIIRSLLDGGSFSGILAPRLPFRSRLGADPLRMQRTLRLPDVPDYARRLLCSGTHGR